MRLALLAAAVTATIVTTADAQTTTRPLTDDEKAVVEAAIEAKLNDPGSAIYRWEPVKTANVPPRYCVEVNAKNRYGGYVGFKPIMVQTAVVNDVITAASRVWFPDESVPEGLGFQIAACQGYGYDVGG
jgi:hypothetical protein